MYDLELNHSEGAKMGFIRNSWYAAGWSSEFGNNLISRTILNEPVVLFRVESGTAVALADRCAHRFAPLSRGKLKGDVLECGYHGLCYDSTGACVFNPHGTHVIPKVARVKSYELVERDGIAWIWMGEPAQSDESKIRSFPQFGNTKKFVSVEGYLHVRANYQLISDNLLDLTHGQYLHPMFANPAGPAKFEPNDDPDPDTIWAKFVRKSQYPNKYFQFLGYPADKLGDHRNFMRWNPPGVLLLDVGMTGVGAPVSEGISIPTAHLLTPETEHTTHYFWAMARDFRLDDEALSKQLLEVGVNIFTNEDKPMIEAQQRAIGDTDDLLSLRPILLSTDGPAVKARRVIQRLLKEAQPTGRVASG
jgi:phenylpropionate dioxygenase-like ring-hydroxylating dioxygenase large terminal subunit